MSSHRVDVAIFAVALAVFGLVGLALVWSGDREYALLAGLNGVGGTQFVSSETGRPVAVDLERLLDWHRRWSAYVIGLADDPPAGSGTFTSDEFAHMAEVRGVFRGAESAGVLALFVVGFRLWRAGARGTALRLVRDGGLVSAALVVAVGIAALLAFDPLFLLFHEVFFPRGNFLFDPATSNLVRLYPEWYWQGVTAGVGLSFIVLALGAAWSAHLVLRSRSTTYTRAA